MPMLRSSLATIVTEEKKGKKRVGAQTLKSALSVGYFLKRGLSPSDLMSPRWVIERVEESAENIENE